jgi:membrane protease YdiL (CAAX protease family)
MPAPFDGLKMRPGSKGSIPFVVLAFAISWSIWFIYSLSGFPSNGDVAQIAVIAGAFGPAIAAIIVRTLVTKEGFTDGLLLPRFRKGWPYYLFAMFWPLLIIAAFMVLAPLMGMGSSGVVGLDLIGLVISTVLLAPLIWGEEYGWRGYLQPRLFPFRPLVAAVVTGLIWGVWHFPALAFGLIPNEHGLASILLFPLYTVLFSIILGWLTIKSRSVWPATLAHSSNNVMLPAFGAIFAFSGGNGDLLYSVQGTLLLLLLGVLSLVIVFSGQLKREPGIDGGMENGKTAHLR